MLKNRCLVPDEGFEPPSAHYKCAAKPTQLIRRYLLTLQLGQKSPCCSSALHSVQVFIHLLSSLFGAGNQVRTDDILLGRQVLYQLSYTRLKNVLTQRVGKFQCVDQANINYVYAVFLSPSLSG